MMLQVDDYRDVFVSIDGISTIMTVLSGRVNFQIQYQLAFCLWICTFNEKLASKMNKYNVIPVLSDILSEAVKEKVTRMILATFRVNFHLFIISFFYWFFVLLIFCSNDDIN
jgi:V-type H+-transporting ATPase subunit H